MEPEPRDEASRRRDGEIGVSRRGDGEIGVSRRGDGEIGVPRRRDGETRASGDELLGAGPSFLRHGEPFNPAQHGFTMVHNYALYFWRPYLGNTAFALWELVASFCYGDKDVAFPSVSRLARILTNSDHSRAVVSGRHGKPPLPDSDGPGSPGYQGALERLRAEGLLQVKQRGRGPTARYQYRVRRTLPLLRPEQVAQLSPLLQSDHAAWLDRYGIDDAAYRQAFGPPAATAAPHPTSEDGSSGPESQSKSTEEQSSTNNPQEQPPIQYWWQETVQELRPGLSPGLFQVSLAGARACAFDDGVLTVQASSAVARETLEHRLDWVVLRTLRGISEGRVTAVRFTCGQETGGKPCAR